MECSPRGRRLRAWHGRLGGVLWDGPAVARPVSEHLTDTLCAVERILDILLSCGYSLHFIMFAACRS
jgi:hypothetical protein